jgi:hypothetical protein
MSKWITTADERLSAPSNIKAAIVGTSGAGKTTLARSLNPADTLFMDGEAGTLALGSWRGSTLDMLKMAAALGIPAWEVARALACIAAGPDHSDYELTAQGMVPGPYSPEAHASYVAAIGPRDELLANVRTIYVDSITVASRWAYAWCARQPEALSEKTGKKDTRGVYGLLGKEMVRWLTRLQHAPFNVMVVGILDRHEDEMHRVTYSPQIEGGKAGRELPGIFDQVMTLTRFNVVDGTLQHAQLDGTERGLVCTANPWGLPGKDRSGCLSTVERPDLSALLAKMNSGQRQDLTLSNQAPAGGTLV